MVQIGQPAHIYISIDRTIVDPTTDNRDGYQAVLRTLAMQANGDSFVRHRKGMGG